MGGDPRGLGNGPQERGDAGGEGMLLRGIWSELERRAGGGGLSYGPGPARGNGGGPRDPAQASLVPAGFDAQGLPAAPPDAGSALVHPDRPEHARLLQSARAVHALNERLGLDMDVPAHRLARDRLTAFVAKVSVLSGVRADELVIGSGSDAFVVQNDAAGRSIARFDTHDAINAPVGDSLDGLAAALRRQVAEREAQPPAIEAPLPKSPLLP